MPAQSHHSTPVHLPVSVPRLLLTLLGILTRKELAKEKTEGARYAKKAYKSLTQIEEADAKVHKAHRKYEGAVAVNELTKKKADVGLAKKLHGLRPGYARLGVGLEKAENLATERIEAIKAKLLGGTEK